MAPNNAMRPIGQTPKKSSSQQQTELVHALELLLFDAQAGLLTGVVCVAERDCNRVETVVAGRYTREPRHAFIPLSTAFYHLSVLIRASGLDPLLFCQIL
jgi:hypothetical protein